MADNADEKPTRRRWLKNATLPAIGAVAGGATGFILTDKGTPVITDKQQAEINRQALIDTVQQFKADGLDLPEELIRQVITMYHLKHMKLTEEKAEAIHKQGRSPAKVAAGTAFVALAGAVMGAAANTMRDTPATSHTGRLEQISHDGPDADSSRGTGRT